ncbi:MAG TPA: hypothetical protein VFJ16_08430 [Longimicrobium sp.]|nr:hypothetical protein [Longimicrobium sp.]
MSTTPPVPEGDGEPWRGWRLAAWIVAAWTVWALYWITEPLAMTGRLSHQDEALEWFYDAATWAPLTIAIFWLARRFPLRRGRLARDVPVHLAAALLVSFCATTSGWAYDRWRGEPQARSYPQRLAHEVRWNTAWYCYVLGIGLAVHYHHEARRRQRQAARLALVASGLEARVAQAQLSAARMRLQPELVFATLGAVARLAPRDPAAADALTVCLADLLRMVTDSFGAREVPLRRDAAYLSAWAALRRFHGLGPQVRLELVDEALAAAVPAFLLQPLAVALVDGFPASHVHVRARVDGGELQVVIVSHGCAPPADTAALDEARSRLRQSHGPSSAIHLVSADGARAVHVCLPCREPAEHARPLAAEG